ncbi:RNA-binding protein MEX3D-like [Macaca thibetana thibetana]|uniref:RNA-binding protein MEX3D-like n=1 Tax=Macaca thibetana thibetana TaxID=257877 RepID=UPI0021BC6101|nr:RNA-binding protein MEX3D-like [Macaca thibetana thibetana]
MTQGNCGRVAVGARPARRLGGGAPAPRPAPSPSAPPRRRPSPLPRVLSRPPPAARPFGSAASLGGGGARGGGGGSRRGALGPRGRGRGAPPRPRLFPPRGAPRPPPASAGSFVLLSSNYLSEPRAPEAPKRGLEGLPSSIRGALSGSEGPESAFPPCLPPSPRVSVFCCLYSSARHSLGCFPPPAWEFAVWMLGEHKCQARRIQQQLTLKTETPQWLAGKAF